MIRDFAPPTEEEEYRNMAEILRDLAAQVRFGNTCSELVNLANKFDRLAAHAQLPTGGASSSASASAFRS